jgi:hypothetical protein
MIFPFRHVSNLGRIWIWISIERESRIRIGIKTLPVHNTRRETKKILTKIKQSDCNLAHFTFC